MRNICWLNNGNTHPPTLCAGEAPHEKLKINELGPKVNEESVWQMRICVTVLGQTLSQPGSTCVGEREFQGS